MFLKRVWSKQNLPDEIYYFDMDSWEFPSKQRSLLPHLLPAPVHVRLLHEESDLLNTSAASTSCNELLLRVCPDTCTVSIPRFSSVSDAAKQLIGMLREDVH